MLSSKHISKITIVLITVVLVLCILAMGFSDKLYLFSNDSGYSLEYEENLFNTDKIRYVQVS